jgi:hypothetical protein
MKTYSNDVWGIVTIDTRTAAFEALLTGGAPAIEGASDLFLASPVSAATTLAAGDIAVIGYNTGTTTTPSGPDSLSFVVTRDIGSGTQIFFTDRTWNGTSFANAAGDGTYAYTAASNLVAGTVVTISQASLSGAGMDLSSAGDTLYAYQGAADAPTRFIHAIEMADGNTTFNGSLVNTGLSGTNFYAAVAGNNANWAGRFDNAQLVQVHASIHDATDWVQNDNSGQTDPTGPLATAPDRQIWVAGSGAGEALVRISTDETVSSGNVGFDLAQMFQNDPNLFHPSDITLDTVHDRFFFIDSDISGGHNRVVQGSISQSLANPGGPLSFTILYADDSASAPQSAHSMRTLSIDAEHGLIYFDHGTTFNKISYDTANQTPTVLANLGSNNFITQATIDYAHGEVYLGSSRVTSFFGTDAVSKNYIYKATGLTSASSTLTFSQLPFSPDDAGVGAPNDPDIPPLTGEAWPVELGTIRGVDVDPVNRVLYFTTGSVILDVGPDQDGTHPHTFYGGVYKYELTGNPNGVVTQLFLQDGVNGPPGLLYYIEVDPNTGQYYVTDETGTNALVDDGGIWVGSTSGGTPTLVSHVGNINGLGPQGLEIQSAPTLSITNTPSPTAVETVGLGSGFTSDVQLISAASTTDVDSAGLTDQLAGAQVRISQGLQTGTGHLDRLTINGATSGTLDFGAKDISYSYDSTNGVMTLSGAQTFANYQAALALVSYSVSGDNPTAYGADPTRTIAWSTFDGLLYSDEKTTTVTVSATNDAPVNGTVAGASGLEDTPFSITGFSVNDVDADPASQDITVTLSVGDGALTLRTDVAGGVTAGDLAGNGTDTVVITATQNQLNATFANATGLRYLGDPNFFGNDILHVVTNDGGLTGTDPGQSGDATSEADTDDFTIVVTPVNDAPTGAANTVTIDEDNTYVFGTADFGFADATDNPAPNSLNRVQVFSLASDGVLMYDADGGGAGVAVAASLLQFISAADIAAGKFFFVPTANENDTTDYAHFNFKLEDDGGTANGGVNLSAAYAFTFNASPVNDAPVVIGATASLAAINEDDAAPAGDTVANLFASHFDDSIDNQASSTADDFAGVAITASNAAGEGVWQYFDGSSWVDITGVSTASALLLDAATSLRFVPAADFNGPAPTLEAHLVDDSAGAITSGDTADLTAAGGVTPYSSGVVALGETINSVNDAPSGTDKTITTDEDAAYTFAAADFGFSDAADGDNLAAVKITTLPGAGVLTLNGVAVSAGDFITRADIDSAKLVFTPAADGNGAGYASLTFQVQDDGGTANGGVDLDASANTLTIDVTSVNDAPSGTDKTITTSEDTAYVFAAADFGFSDAADGNTLAAVKIATQPGAGTLTLDGVAVNAGDLIAVADIDAGKLVFTPAADASGSGYASLSFQVQDDGGTLNGGVDLDPSANTLTIDVTSVNDAPSGADKTVTTNEDAAYTFAAADFGFTDPADGDSLLAVKITTLPGAGVLTLDGVAVSAGDFVSRADIDAAKLVFTPAADGNGAGYASLTFQVQDDGGTANGGVDLEASANTLTIDVTSVNDAPSGADNFVSTTEDTAYVIAASDFGFSDGVDGDDLLAVKITTLPGAGSLTLDGTAVAVGDFISKTDIDAGKLVFTPGADGNGSAYASIGFQVQDDGGTSNGGVDLDPTANTLTIDVFTVNDAPSGADRTVSASEDSAYIFAAADFGFSDPADGDSLLAVKIASLPVAGALTLNGVAVNAGDLIAVADIDAGKLEFTPAADANGSGYADFTFQVQDDGGTFNGGVDLDPTANTITIDVSAKNDAPTVATPIADQTGYFGEAFSFAFGAGAFNDVDGDSLTYTAFEVVGGSDQALPGWLTFTPGTRQLSGTPASGDIGVHTIKIVADDGHGGQVFDVFDLDVTGNLALLGTFPADTLVGHRGDDTLVGRGGDDLLIGGAGKDRLLGGQGADTLMGGNGGDKLNGDGGDDVLSGGFGRDKFLGGDGHDTFVFDDGEIPGGATRETIRDFVQGDDRIDLSAMDANGAKPGDTAFTFLGLGQFTGAGGEIHVREGPVWTILQFDLDGDKVADFELGVLTADHLLASDFVL